MSFIDSLTDDCPKNQKRTKYSWKEINGFDAKGREDIRYGGQGAIVDQPNGNYCKSSSKASHPMSKKKQVTTILNSLSSIMGTRTSGNIFVQ
jgi:hypothetical protein